MQDPSPTAAVALTKMLMKVKMFMFPIWEVENLRNLLLPPSLWLNRWSHCCCLHFFTPQTDSNAEQPRAEMRMVRPWSHAVLRFWGAAKSPGVIKTPKCQQWHHGSYTRGRCARNMHGASTDLAVRNTIVPAKGIPWAPEGSTKKAKSSQTHVTKWLERTEFRTHCPAKILCVVVLHE